MASQIPQPFVGRRFELTLLQQEYDKPTASLVVMYGRRRIGKTRLITEFYADKHLWRFDGIEGAPKSRQIRAILKQLSQRLRTESYAALVCTDWIDLFKIIDRAIAQSPQKYCTTLFLDELPYMANRQSELVSALKWAWDNLWCNKPDYTLVLCGSIASFMIKKVVKSSALYGRISLEICLRSLLVPEVMDFFGKKKSIREVCNLYMICGGIPEYLRQINPKESIAHNMARLAFCKDGYFTQEFDRLFKDILAEERIYKRIIMTLAKYKSLKAPELTSILKVSGGGGFMEYLDNLESAGFVRSIVPWDRLDDSKLKRFQLSDEYLLFYFQFVYPHLKKIRDNTHIASAIAYATSRAYATWTGFAFERLCLRHVPQIMQHLKIDQLVKASGAYFDRASNTKDGLQIDLMFVRHDPVITLCEMKYANAPIGKWIIKDVERKVALLKTAGATIEKVLITTEGMTQDLRDNGYFSTVLLADQLFAVC